MAQRFYQHCSATWRQCMFRAVVPRLMVLTCNLMCDGFDENELPLVNIGLILITFYSPSCLGQETAKGPFGLRLRVKLGHLPSCRTLLSRSRPLFFGISVTVFECARALAPLMHAFIRVRARFGE